MSSYRMCALVLLILVTVACDSPLSSKGSRTPFQHLELLSSWEHRRAGTSNIREAQEYVHGVLHSYGYETSYQEFIFPFYELRKYSISDGSSTYHSFPVHYSGTTAGIESGVTAEVVDGKGDIEGKILFSEYTGYSGLKDDVERAVEEGAVGVIRGTKRQFYYSQDLVFAGRLELVNWTLPHIPVMTVEGAANLLGKEITLVNEAYLTEGQGRNIIGIKPGTSGKYIMITAHLDSWFNGAVDDGSGVAVLLETAEQLRTVDSDTGLIFLVTDAEEVVIIGSAVYARSIDASSIMAVLELDMVSALNTYRTTEEGIQESIPPFLVYSYNVLPQAKVFSTVHTGPDILLPATLVSWFVGIRTDYEWFWAQGVPGLFVNVLSEYYHTEADTISLVDPEDLQSVSDASVQFIKELLSTNDIGRSPFIDVRIDALQSGDEITIDLFFEDILSLTRHDITVEIYYNNGLMERFSEQDWEESTYSVTYPPQLPGEYEVLGVVKGITTGMKWTVIDVDLPQI